MEEIKPEKYYTPRKLVAMNFLPWLSPRTFTKKVQEKHWQEIFKPIIEISKGKKLIYIKGEYIIKFNELAKDGKLII